jgi:hypothetical protein
MKYSKYGGKPDNKLDNKLYNIKGSNDIDTLTKENNKIINIILQYDSITDNKENLKEFLDNFELSNKYFMFKNDKEIRDPKILKYLFNYYNTKWKKYSDPLLIDTKTSNKDKTNINNINQQLNTINKNNKDININYDTIKNLKNFIIGSIAINKSDNPFSEYLDYYDNYELYKKYYKKIKYKPIDNLKQLVYKNILKQTIYNLGESDNLSSNKILKDYIYTSNTLKSIKDIQTNISDYSITSIINTNINMTNSSNINSGFIEINKRLYNLYILYHNNLNKIINIRTQEELKKLREAQSNKDTFLDDLKSKLNEILKERLNKSKHQIKFQASLEAIHKLSTQNIQNIQIPELNKELVIDNPSKEEIEAHEEIEDLEDEHYEKILTPLEEYSKICKELKPIITEMINIYTKSVKPVQKITESILNQNPSVNNLYLSHQDVNDFNQNSKVYYNILYNNYINSEIKIDENTYKYFQELNKLINITDLKNVPADFKKIQKQIIHVHYILMKQTNIDLS